MEKDVVGMRERILGWRNVAVKKTCLSEEEVERSLLNNQGMIYPKYLKFRPAILRDSDVCWLLNDLLLDNLLCRNDVESSGGMEVGMAPLRVKNEPI